MGDGSSGKADETSKSNPSGSQPPTIARTSPEPVQTPHETPVIEDHSTMEETPHPIPSAETGESPRIKANNPGIPAVFSATPQPGQTSSSNDITQVIGDHSTTPGNQRPSPAPNKSQNIQGNNPGIAAVFSDTPEPVQTSHETPHPIPSAETGESPRIKANKGITAVCSATPQPGQTSSSNDITPVIGDHSTTPGNQRPSPAPKKSQNIQGNNPGIAAVLSDTPPEPVQISHVVMTGESSSPGSQPLTIRGNQKPSPTSK